MPSEQTPAAWPALSEIVLCPHCGGALAAGGPPAAVGCRACGRTYPFVEGTLDLAGTGDGAPPVEKYRRPVERRPPARGVVLREYRRGHALRRCLMHAEITAMAPLQGLTLDLGSGREPRDPTYARVLPIGPGAQVVRVDLLPGRGVNVSADFGRPLPFRDESADAVLFLNLLEHLYEPGLLLREIRRVLKPGGRAVGYVPFLALLHGSPSDFCRYTEHALERMLGEAGFASVLISPHGGMFQLVCTAWDELARAWLPFRLALSPTVWLSLALDDLLERPTKSRLRRRAVLGYWLEAVRPPASTVPEAARSAASGRPP